MPVKIVELALFAVREDLVGVGDLFEALLGFLVAGIFVRVIFESQPPVGAFDFLQGRFPGDPQNLIIFLHPDRTIPLKPCCRTALLPLIVIIRAGLVKNE